jgi:very-short-patch-repair endonuclease
MPKSDIHNIARNLRKNQTQAEILLWSKLRSRNLSGCKFRRQHPIDNVILDFYCCKTHLAIEIDGGHHADEAIMKNDEERTAYLNQKGIKLIRFWNHDVLENLDDVLAEIDATLQDIMKKNVDR